MTTWSIAERFTKTFWAESRKGSTPIRSAEQAKDLSEVLHILSQPDDDWRGARGHIDREKIERYADEFLAQGHFYLCGPPAMTQGLIEILGELGVQESRIFFESFSL
jgi:NAD(P)H-flavin reductase